MKKWTLLEETSLPGGTRITLHQHDRDYVIRVNGLELMSTRKHASEEELAEVACASLTNRPGARLLIGGLGFGFTLKAALAILPRDAKIVVAEISPAVIAWNRNPRFALAAEAMADPRVEIAAEDVVSVIARHPETFDSIALDVDNGAAALSAPGNVVLYQPAGLEKIVRALRPKGCLVVWSAGPEPELAKLMTRSGFATEVKRARARPNGGGWHTLSIGRLR